MSTPVKVLNPAETPRRSLAGAEDLPAGSQIRFHASVLGIQPPESFKLGNHPAGFKSIIRSPSDWMLRSVANACLKLQPNPDEALIVNQPRSKQDIFCGYQHAMAGMKIICFAPEMHTPETRNSGSIGNFAALNSIDRINQCGCGTDLEITEVIMSAQSITTTSSRQMSGKDGLEFNVRSRFVCAKGNNASESSIALSIEARLPDQENPKSRVSVYGKLDNLRCSWEGHGRSLGYLLRFDDSGKFVSEGSEFAPQYKMDHFKANNMAVLTANLSQVISAADGSPVLSAKTLTRAVFSGFNVPAVA